MRLSRASFARTFVNARARGDKLVKLSLPHDCEWPLWSSDMLIDLEEERVGGTEAHLVAEDGCKYPVRILP